MAGEGKVRKGFYIEEDLLEQIDGLLEQADVKSRNEFLNQALKFYIGYLTSEKIENYMLSTISSVMHSKDVNNIYLEEIGFQFKGELTKEVYVDEEYKDASVFVKTICL